MNPNKNKKKNRQNKTINSNPQENVEHGSKIEEKVENMQVETIETVTKVEKRVPEILSEVVLLPSHESKEEIHNDGPKKPKKNRGKKKTFDKEDNEEEQRKNESESKPIVEDDEKSIKQKESVKVEPAARKKKGNNKTTEETTHDISKLQSGEFKVDEIKMESLVTSEVLSELIDQEIKPAKKKNKKNKKSRNDSEKSEEASCTAAFQNILQPRNDVVTIKEKIDSPDMKISDSSISESTMKEVENANILNKCQVAKAEEEIAVECSKKTSKLKNKKDKKHLPKDEHCLKDDTENVEEDKIDIHSFTIDDSLKKHVANEPSDVKFIGENIAEKSSNDGVLKPKAIIAKPVEKKEKSKTEKNPVSKTEETTESKTKGLEKNKGKEIDKEYSKIDVFGETCDVVKTTESIYIKNKETIKSKVEVKSQSGLDKQYAKIYDFIVDAKVTKPSEIIDTKTTEIPKDVNTSEKEISKDIAIKTEEIVVIDETKDHIKQVKPRLKKGKGKGKANIYEQTKLTEISDKIATENIATADTIQSVELSKPLQDKLDENKEPLNTDVQFKLFDDEEKEVTGETIMGEDLNIDAFEIVKHRQKKGKGKHSIQQDDPKTMPEIPETMMIKEEKIAISGEIIRDSDIKQGILESQQNMSPENVNILIDSPIVIGSSGSEIEIEQKVDVVLKTDNIGVPKDKKRKKSPKPPEKLIKLPTLEEKPKAENENNISMTSKTAEMSQKKFETPIIKDSAEVTELNPNMIQSTGSEFTPDFIEHPRSTSAEIIDDNNNMTILELNTSESGFSVPLVIPSTPLIRGSGETPSVSPIVIATCVKVEELNISEEKEIQSIKKTDLKSQVMEVNRDMEELRLSIERSLAEFTALEKEDQSIGIKPYELKTNIDLQQTQTIEHQCHEKPAENISDKMLMSVLKASKEEIITEPIVSSPEPPVCPARKDNKGKNKSKKKGNVTASSTSNTSSSTTGTDAYVSTSQEMKKEETTKQENDSKSSKSQEKVQQQATFSEKDENSDQKLDDLKEQGESMGHLQDFDPIENFEDALTSSMDDVNETFDIIADEAVNDCNSDQTLNVPKNPEINVTEPEDNDKAKEETQRRENPLVSQPKNLLGHPVIPVRSNKTDYKKEKNKTPNAKIARVKIKDAVDVDQSAKLSKQCQTENKPKLIKNQNMNESVTCVTSENDEYVYKYSFRKVFLSSNCHVCKKELKNVRVPCNFCFLTFYCSQKHKDEDYAQHQALCVAVSTIVHLKGQKHIYADAQGVTGHNYRLLRMQTIVSCEKVLKRKLVPWEQEALLYPRMCADQSCREWRQGKLKDCEDCGQISYCSDNHDHFPKSHARWCNSYCLYQKLVVYQLTQGRVDPRLPAKLLNNDRICDNINRLLADMYDEKIDINDMQYAALTQLGTAPLTAAYSYQLYHDKIKQVSNGDCKNSTFTIHVVGAELQFEADSLHKWETFFLHLKPDVEELRVVLIGPELNPSNLPLDLLGKIKLCATCRVDKRRISFFFQDKQLYHEYWSSDDFITPDIVCAFNPSINRSSSYDDVWSSSINCIFRFKTPFLITSYTMNEIQRDLGTIKKYATVDYNTVSEAKFNPFASVRPDRNFITDDEMPLLFKNYVYSVLIGAM